MELSQVGKFKIVDKLGQGAMGEVFRALDPVLGREVAIKVVTGKLSADEGARVRFLREAQSAAQLNHPNIITVYDFGEEQGMAFMAMELLEGNDLRQLLAQGTLTTLEDKLTVMDQILDGLAFAHSKGVVHRDLKPGNVYVLPSGQIKIMDFGLARRAQDAAATGVIMGTPFYMAPEQAQGERAGPRTDIFSLGAMFYEILSGKRPFTGPSIPAVLFAVAHRDPEPLGSVAPDIPPGLVTVVMRALSKKPRDRYEDAGAMLSAVRTAWGGMAAGHGYAAADLAPARDLSPALSTLPDTSFDLRTALEEVNQYLDDRVPPLVVADSVAAFLEAPVEGAAAELLQWAERQQSAQPDLPIVDLFFHALHKLSVIGEFHLVDGERLLAFLRAVGAVLAETCAPGAERDRFRRALSLLGESEMVRTGAVDMVRLRPDAAPAEVAAPPATAGLRRLSLLEQRLRREGVSQGPAAEAARRRVGSQAITAAATEARSERELEDHLRRLRSAGVESGAQQVFRNLGEELADWAMPRQIVSDTADLGPADESVKAMKNIVSLPEDPIEVARRFRHLVSAATEQFNSGNLGRAVQMFELATKLSSEKKVEAGFMEPILRKGHEALDDRRLRQYMDKPDRHAQLQSVMAFFGAGLGPAALLDQLETEERRDRRKLLLDLLVVHGETARAAARSRLEASVAELVNDFARRNWIYLLRLIPRVPGEAAASEIDAVARFASPGNPAFLAKEALTLLGQTRHPRAADALVSLLAAWERELEREGLDEEALEEGLASLDRIAPALARQDGAACWAALVEHALSGDPKLGDATARLAELGTRDLSGSPEVVETLLGEIRDGLPRGMLGRLVGRKGPDVPPLILALAGTRSPEVRALLEDVRKRMANQEAGRAAARALESPPVAAAPAAVAGHSGELDPYGLPALLHRLAEGRATGTLNLLPKEGGGVPATIAFRHGRPATARWAHREGDVAVYQLFERPFAGSFAFDAGSVPPAGGGALPDLAALVKEGVRRARELQHTSAVVPEELPLEATGGAPGTVVDEPDYDLIVKLWEKACARVSVRQMEAELAADAFRIHRALAQWLEEGALRIATGTAPGT